MPRTSKSLKGDVVRWSACGLLLVAAVAMFFLNEAWAQTKPSTNPMVKPKVEKPGWRLSWSDEFDDGTAPDPKKWGYEVDFVRNNEKQYYTKDRRENARIEDGTLILEGRREKFVAEDGTKADYTSASITTQGKFSFTYGRVDVRAKIPTGRGTWPAIWTLGDNIDKVSWPRCGEIDIMENVGFDPVHIHGTVHTTDRNHTKKTQAGAKIRIDRPWEDFHVYSIEWDEKKIEWFVDGNRYHTYVNDGKGEGTWPFDKPQFLLLNFAIGGAWGGAKGIDDSIFSQKFEIDYVRVYERVKTEPVRE